MRLRVTGAVPSPTQLAGWVCFKAVKQTPCQGRWIGCSGFPVVRDHAEFRHPFGVLATPYVTRSRHIALEGSLSSVDKLEGLCDRDLLTAPGSAAHSAAKARQRSPDEFRIACRPERFCHIGLRVLPSSRSTRGARHARGAATLPARIGLPFSMPAITKLCARSGSSIHSFQGQHDLLWGVGTDAQPTGNDRRIHGALTGATNKCRGWSPRVSTSQPMSDIGLECTWPCGFIQSLPGFRPDRAA